MLLDLVKLFSQFAFSPFCRLFYLLFLFLNVSYPPGFDTYILSFNNFIVSPTFRWLPNFNSHPSEPCLLVFTTLSTCYNKYNEDCWFTGSLQSFGSVERCHFCDYLTKECDFYTSLANSLCCLFGLHTLMRMPCWRGPHGKRLRVDQ